MAPFFMRDDFLKYAQTEKRFSEHTILAYNKDLTQFFEFIGAVDKHSISEINSKVIRGWMVELLEKDISPSSVNRKLSSLRTYFKWLSKEGIIQMNPTQTVVGPKTKKQIPSFAQENELEVEKMESLFEDDFEGMRDHLIFELLYQTGMRSNELVELKSGNIQLDKIKVLGKRNKERIIPISTELFNHIKRYENLKSEINVQTDCLLVLKSGKKLYPKFVYRKINDYLGRVTGLRKKSPHILRHTFATHMLNNGAGLEVLKEILGHANLSATQIYTHNSFAQLTSIYSQSHPRGHKK